MPYFSVVIPTYNRAEFIVNTLNSVLSQDYDDFEIIVVDDGSTDNTADIMRENYATSRKVRYVRQSNAERGAARNRGFKETRSEYTVFFDSDDLMHSDHLSTLAAAATRHPEANFLATKYQMQRDGKAYPSALHGLAEGFYGLELFLRGNPLACNICVKRDNPRLSLFVEDRRYAVFEDWMFMVQNLASDRMYLSDRVTISLVDHDNRSMRGNNQEIIRKNRLARDWILENVPLSEDQKRILDGYSHYFCAIHSYLDTDRARGLNHLYHAFKRIGVNRRVAALLLKMIVGRKLLLKASR